jgi:hypothetical protein
MKHNCLTGIFTTFLSALLILGCYISTSAEVQCRKIATLYCAQDENLPKWSDSYVHCSDSLMWSLEFTVCEAPEWGAISAYIFGTAFSIDVFSFEYDPDHRYVLTGRLGNIGVRNSLLLDLVVGPPPGHFKDILFTVYYYGESSNPKSLSK